MNEINYTIEGSLKMGLNNFYSFFTNIFKIVMLMINTNKSKQMYTMKIQVHEKESLEKSLPHYGVVVALGSVYLFHYSCTKCTSLLGLKFI